MSKEIVTREDRVKAAIEKILQGPITPGSAVPIEKLEEWFCLSSKNQTFGFIVSELRHALFYEGLYLSGEGVEQSEAYHFEEPQNHHFVAKIKMARAERSLDGMEILLRNTDTTNFSKWEKQRHEATLREVSMKAKVLRRMAEVENASRPMKKKLSDQSEAEPSTT